MAGHWEEVIALVDEAAPFQSDEWELSALLSMRGTAHLELGDGEEALADYERALELDPGNYRHNNNLAWALATCPQRQLRDADRAVRLAQVAIELNRESGLIWNTLGVACYRQGSIEQAIDALTESMQLRGGGDLSDWLFLAMSHWQLGDKTTAASWYDRSLTWIQQHPHVTAEMTRFRAEAERLLEG